VQHQSIVEQSGWRFVAAARKTTNFGHCQAWFIITRVFPDRSAMVSMSAKKSIAKRGYGQVAIECLHA